MIMVEIEFGIQYIEDQLQNRQSKISEAIGEAILSVDPDQLA